MSYEFYSLQTLILVHLAQRLMKGGDTTGIRPYCDESFLHALAMENNR